MKTAASYEITKIRVNPAGGEIEELYINHEKVDMGSDSLQDNKEVTIDASSYTDPVEVTPSSGKIAMKKATVTVSNIPVIESNKAVTIDVSAYTEPVEITPTSGKDGMSKATVTLSNIPSGGSADLAKWTDEESGVHYFNIKTAPEDGYVIYQLTAIGDAFDKTPLMNRGDTYAKTSDTVFTVTDSSENTVTYTRDSTGDVTIW